MKYQDNIEEVVRFNPDYLGFIFYQKSTRYIGNQHIPTTATKNVNRVGVFVNEDFDYIEKTYHTFPLDLVQLHGDETPALVKRLSETGIPVMKAISIGTKVNWDTVEAFEPYVNFFLFDTATAMYGGSGRKFNWEVLQNYALNTPYFLSGGLHPEDIPEIIALNFPGLTGLDFNSRCECSPGVKDVNIIQQIYLKLNHYAQ